MRQSKVQAGHPHSPHEARHGGAPPHQAGHPHSPHEARHGGAPPHQAALNWSFAVPALVLMAIVSLVPIGQTFLQAGDFSRIASDSILHLTLKNTVFFTFATVLLELVLGLAMALVLVQPFPGRGWARAAVLIPWALPTAIMAMAWQWIFNADYGVMGDLLYKFGLVSSPRIAWLASSNLAMAACILADVWKTTPFMALLLMSGLAGIPKDIYEAASIDGAGPIRQFFMITLPLLRPTLALACIFRAIQSFGVFDLIWVLTGGGPGNGTKMIALYVYDNAFRYFNGEPYAYALTLVMALFMVGISAVFYVGIGAREEIS